MSAGGHGQSFCILFFSPFEKDLEVLEPFSPPFSSAIFYANIKEIGGE